MRFLINTPSVEAARSEACALGHLVNKGVLKGRVKSIPGVGQLARWSWA